jgi:hypothetical protein
MHEIIEKQQKKIMAKKNNSARRHSSPGLYFTDTVVNYATKSLGITSLGVVGETLRGRAFEPTEINDWGEFIYNFGGTSTEKYRGSQYPKYELPYIAQSYLEESHNLKVVRVLGLSGVNAGPAWVITANSATQGDEYDNMVVMVLRSRGEHKKTSYTGETDECGNPKYEYDGIEYYAKSVALMTSASLNLNQDCVPGYDTVTGNFNVSPSNYGSFTLVVTRQDDSQVRYPVTLNPSDKNYVYNVIGADPEKGDAEIYIEELYDVALRQLVNEGKLTQINSFVCSYSNISIVPSHEDVYDILTEAYPTRDMVGKRYIFSESMSVFNGNKIKVCYNSGSGWGEPVDGLNGYIYTVYLTQDSVTNKRSYFYGSYGDIESATESEQPEHITRFTPTTDIVDKKFTNCVRVVLEDSFYFNLTKTEGGTSVTDITPITLDFNNYKEQYRWAVSPWIVSEMKGSANNVELNKLFRFHSISDGSNSNTEFKVSIENIDPSTGKFDVVIRDFYDSDLSVNPYEKYLSCDLVPGSPNYIALKIGSTDGMYTSKSRYVTVEVIESDEVKSSIPSGFLGYPIRNYKGAGLYRMGIGTLPNAPYFRFNTTIDEDIKPKKQYFGVSDLVGIDEDFFKYKGVEAYDGNPKGLTPCFHLDARILNGTPNENGEIIITTGTNEEIKQIVSVDGVTGYSWVTVSKNNTVPNAPIKIEPRIGDEATMIGTIYEDKAYRKFTVCMYGGWDGWDYYRTTRSNGNEYQYKEYKGAIDNKSGYGSTFSVYPTPEALGFDNTTIINSDYYAYLGGAKLLGNPKSVTVNVLATPGIDYVNNKDLVEDIIDIVEEERGDLIYVITTPDKPSGAGDSVDEMYTPQDAVYNLEDSDIDSNHCCTYYPWVKYYDPDNYQYVYLPLTRDVVRSIAYTDNVKFSWYANAGWNRGNIPDNASPRKKLTLNEQDTLYDGRINFVNSFAEEGNKIWGDKNLQIDDNLLNRISKRRLLLRIRTMLQNACIGLIFDPNDLTMSQTVRSAVTKVLDDVKTGRGITDYKIEIDDSAETRDQLGLNVTYHIKPIQALEWINFTSVLTPEGMEWT